MELELQASWVFVVLKHLEITFPHSWPKNGEETRAEGPEVLVEAGPAACSSLCLPTLVFPAMHKPHGLGLCWTPFACTWVVVIYASGSCPEFPARISLPQQNSQPSPCTGVLLCAPRGRLPAWARRREHAQTARVPHVAVCPQTHVIFIISPPVASQHMLAPRHALPYFPRRQSSDPAGSWHPRFLLKLRGCRRGTVGAWCCGSWCQGSQPGRRALTQPAWVMLPCGQS